MVLFIVTGLILIVGIATGTVASKAIGACLPKEEDVESGLKEMHPENQVSDTVSAAPSSSVTNPNSGETLGRVAAAVFRRINVGEREIGHQKKLYSFGEQGGIPGRGLEAKVAEVFHENHIVEQIFRQKQLVRRFWCPPPTVMRVSTEQRSPLQPPTFDDVYEFLGRVFRNPKVTGGCSSVVLDYVERAIDVAHVPLVASTWKPVLLGALVLACKVSQKRCAWEAEFSRAYPEYSEESIWTIQMILLGAMKPHISAVDFLYVRFYSSLESLVEDEDFARSRSQMLGVVASFIAGREAIVKREVVRMRSKLGMSCRGQSTRTATFRTAAKQP